MIRPQQEMFYGHQELCDDRKKLDFLPIQDFFIIWTFLWFPILIILMRLWAKWRKASKIRNFKAAFRSNVELLNGEIGIGHKSSRVGAKQNEWKAEK